jgi:hypothetical protein
MTRAVCSRLVLELALPHGPKSGQSHVLQEALCDTADKAPKPRNA